MIWMLMLIQMACRVQMFIRIMELSRFRGFCGLCIATDKWEGDKSGVEDPLC